MKNCKKRLFLFLSLVVCSQFLFAGHGNTEWPLLANKQTVGFADAYGRALSFPILVSSYPADAEASAAAQPVTFSKQIAKQKKKVKRIFNCSTRLRQPVKDLDPVSVNIFTKETYSKPFFLSHLHHFLFRLTPF